MYFTPYKEIKLRQIDYDKSYYNSITSFESGCLSLFLFFALAQCPSNWGGKGGQGPPPIIFGIFFLYIKKGLIDT